MGVTWKYYYQALRKQTNLSKKNRRYFLGSEIQRNITHYELKGKGTPRKTTLSLCSTYSYIQLQLYLILALL